MKVKLITREENYTKLKKMLEKGGFEVDDNAKFILKEKFEQNVFLGERNGEIILVQYSDVLYVESYGRNVYLNTNTGFLRLKNRLYEVEESLEGFNFLRISKSVIINREGIQSIKPIINGRYDLIMKNNQKVTVTKSYRNSFRIFIGF